jgi:molybdate transport system ATP-binding protein
MARLEFDIALERGEFQLSASDSRELAGVTALFGPSGSGKTTLLRCLAGLEPDCHGRVSFAGQVWQDDSERLPTHRRGVSLVFQDTRLFPHLDVAGNLRYAERRATGARGADFDAVVEQLGLTALLDRQTESLSGGEKQRVAIGRSLLARPRLLLMDEPLAALDLARRAELLPYLESLPRTFDVPILYVTHALDEVARLAMQMVALVDGRIQAGGPTAAMLERLDLASLAGPAEAGVLLVGRVAAVDPRYALARLEVSGQELSVPVSDVPVGSELRLRVRARDVAIATRRPEDLSIRNVLAARILEIALSGDSPFAEVLLDLGGAHLRARLTRASVDELGLARGQSVFALIKSIAIDGQPLTAEI